MIFAGIDYSMSSPAIFIADSDNPNFNDGKVYFITSVKKNYGKFANIRSEFMLDWSTNEERYDFISEYFVRIIKEHKVEFVMIEGYSMGSRTGLVFNIAENGGLLKYKLYKEKIPFDVIAPTIVKKFATGKGNAKKDKMYESFLEETGTDLEKLLNSKCSKNPISDIVDSYFIAKYFLEKKHEKCK